MTSESIWDVSASVWADWEHLGTDGSMILPFLPSVQSPILVVGAGQGMLMAALRQDGYTVVGIDSSQEMIAEARQRRHLEIQHGSAEELPFADEIFATVIIQTGVLTERPHTFMQTVMQEAVRVLAKGGHLVAGLALFSAGTKAILGEIGLVYEQQMQLPRFFDLWHAGPHEKQWAQLISNWNHITQAEAVNVVIKYRDILYATYANWEQFAQPLRDQGLAPADVLRTLVNTPVPLFTFDDYSSLFTQNGLTVCESYWEPEVNTLNLMGKK
jgi:SAM-dependent methyltransferase